MTTKVFIAGSMNIKNLDLEVRRRIDNIVEQDFEVIVGDADGADTSVQHYLLNLSGSRVTIFCSGSTARNNVGDWPVESVVTTHKKGSRAFFTAKDLRMAQVADYGLMVWDAKSTGTLSNVIELLSRNKKSVVFVNKAKTFCNVGTVEQLEDLVSHMSEHAKKKADEKIGLLKRIENLKSEKAQARMFV